MRRKMNDKDRRGIARAAIEIMNDFEWQKSSKGNRYWESVCNELMRIAKTGEP